MTKIQPKSKTKTKQPRWAPQIESEAPTVALIEAHKAAVPARWR